MSILIRFLRVSFAVAVLFVLAACASAQTPAPTVVPTVAPTQANANDLHIHLTQVDTSQFPQVTVYVSVTDANGQPASVEASNIAISEENQAVQTNQIKGAAKVKALTTLLVIDASDSINQNGKLDPAKQAALAYVNQMRPGDKVGLLTFNPQVTYVQPLTEDENALTNAINSLKAINDTAMYDALVKTTEI